MDRGIPGELLPAHGEHAEENLFLTRHVSVDPDGLSFSAQTFARHPGLPQPKGIGFRSWRKQVGGTRFSDRCKAKEDGHRDDCLWRYGNDATLAKRLSKTHRGEVYAEVRWAGMGVGSDRVANLF